MSKGSIVLLIIAGTIIISGPVLKDIAREKNDEFGHYFPNTPPHAKRELQKADDMIRYSKYSYPVGSVLGVVGVLWLIVSAIQGTKKKEGIGSFSSRTTAIDANHILTVSCPQCGQSIAVRSKFCDNCGYKF